MVAAFGGGAISSLENILRSGVDSANAGVDAARQGVAQVIAGGGRIRQDAQSMREQASKVNAQANAAIANAEDARGVYDELGPLAEMFGIEGDALWKQGLGLDDLATDLYGQGAAILNMDPNAGGLASEFVKYWQQLDPDAYVSRATSDVNGAFGNSFGQAVRDLSRRGVSPTSGAYGALMRQKSQMLATALAAAKTNARQTGMKEQAAQLDKMVAAMNTMYGLGNSTTSEGLAAKNQALAAQGEQAALVNQRAAGIINVGNLQLSAGQLFGTAGSLFQGAAGVENSYLSLLESAYGQLASSNASAASAKLSAAGIEVSANNGGGGGGGGGVIIEPSKGGGDDWMNWKGTGHSESWNKNHLPTEQFRALAAK